MRICVLIFFAASFRRSNSNHNIYTIWHDLRIKNIHRGQPRHAASSRLPKPFKQIQPLQKENPKNKKIEEKCSTFDFRMHCVCVCVPSNSKTLLKSKIPLILCSIRFMGNGTKPHIILCTRPYSIWSTNGAMQVLQRWQDLSLARNWKRDLTGDLEVHFKWTETRQTRSEIKETSRFERYREKQWRLCAHLVYFFQEFKNLHFNANELLNWNLNLNLDKMLKGKVKNTIRLLLPSFVASE